jgi:hypothetical protein
MKASFIFDHKRSFSSQKPDLLLPRILDFIQKYFLQWGEHRDWQNLNWKSFQLLEQHCEYVGYDFLEGRDMVQERIGRKLICFSLPVSSTYDAIKKLH